MFFLFGVVFFFFLVLFFFFFSFVFWLLLLLEVDNKRILTMTLDEWDVGSELGQGLCGGVKKATRKRDGHQVFFSSYFFVYHPSFFLSHPSLTSRDALFVFLFPFLFSSPPFFSLPSFLTPFPPPPPPPLPSLLGRPQAHRYGTTKRNLQILLRNRRTTQRKRTKRNRNPTTYET